MNLASIGSSPTINIGGNFNQSGGTFTSSGTGIATVVFTGGSSSVTFDKTAGTLTNNRINWQIASGKTVALNSNLTLVDSLRTMTVNGAFQINQGAYPGNSGTWMYNPGATLIFNNSSGSYGVNNEAWWPTSNGPTNVTVQGAGGITMNVARTVTGLFQTSAGVIDANNLTLNGTAQINTGGFFTGSPTFGSSSLLQYNSGTTYGRGEEWNATSGAGYPANVQISNNTTLNLGNGGIGTPRQMAGNLTIDSGSTLSMNVGGSEMTAALTVLGNATINGTLTLSGSIGGDITVGGNWINNGSFNANARAVTFNGTTTVSGSSTTSFAYVTITGVLTGHATRMNVANDWTNNGTFNHNNGAVYFNGSTVIGGSSISSFFDVFLEPASSLTGPSGNVNVDGNCTSSGAFVAGAGTVTYNGASAQTVCAWTYNNLTVNKSGGSTATLGGAVTVNGNLAISAGTLDTSSANNYALTLNGSFTNSGTFSANASPITIGGTVGNPSIAGFSTTGALSFTRTAGTATLTGAVTASSLTVNGAGGVLYLGAGLTHQINGDVTITAGTLYGDSSTLGLTGNWTYNNTVFSPGTGTITFNGSSAQTVGGSKFTSFNNLTINNPAGVTLGSNQFVTTLTLTNGVLNLGGKVLGLAGSPGSISASGAKSITGPSNSALDFRGPTTVTGGPLTFEYPVAVIVQAAVDFGASVSTINGSLTLFNGGSVISNSPTYGLDSYLQYNTGDVHNRGAEWSTATSGPGYAAHLLPSPWPTSAPSSRATLCWCRGRRLAS